MRLCFYLPAMQIKGIKDVKKKDTVIHLQEKGVFGCLMTLKLPKSPEGVKSIRFFKMDEEKEWNVKFITT